MLIIPEYIKDLFRSNNNRRETQKKFKLKFYDDVIDALYPYETLFPTELLFPSEHGEPWLEIGNDRISSESLKITEALSSSNDLVFGSCESTQFEIVVADVVEDVTGKEFSLTVEIDGYEMALGLYTVQSFVRQSDRRKRKITAYDRMSWFNVDVADWYNELTFPMPLKSFRDSLCRYIGIEQEETSLILDSMQIEKTIEPTSISGIDILRAICEINGCFGHIDKTGILKYVHLQQTGLYPSETLFPENDLFSSEFGGDGAPVEKLFRYKQPMTYEDYLVEEITGLSIRGEKGDIGASVGESRNIYEIEGNFLVYGKSAVDLLNIAQSILPVILGKTYRPAKVQCNCMPWVEVGDAIRIYTNNDIVETLVMKRTISGCQAMVDTIESTGAQQREGTFGINKQIIQLEGKTATIIKNVDEVSVKLTDLGEHVDTQLAVVSGEIKAEVTRATKEEEKLSGRLSVTEKEIELKVSKGNVSAQISVESDGVTIRGNRFSWQSTYSSLTSDGKLKCVDGDFSGKITANTGVIGGFKISGNSLSASNDNTEIRFGNYYFDRRGVSLQGVEIDEDGIYIGSIGNRYSHIWESQTGDIYVNEIYIDDPWWKDWSVTETVRELWEYVYGGGWNPCGSDSCDGGCDGGGCGCDEEECDSGCEIECDCSDCDGGCDTCDYCVGDGCDGSEGPGCGCSCDGDSCDSSCDSIPCHGDGCDGSEGPGCV